MSLSLSFIWTTRLMLTLLAPCDNISTVMLQQKDSIVLVWSEPGKLNCNFWSIPQLLHDLEGDGHDFGRALKVGDERHDGPVLQHHHFGDVPQLWLVKSIIYSVRINIIRRMIILRKGKKKFAWKSQSLIVPAALECCRTWFACCPRWGTATRPKRPPHPRISCSLGRWKIPAKNP